MKVEQDYEDFIELLNANNVRYLIVGAVAAALYTNPRNTGDLDIFIEPVLENAEKVMKVLNEFGLGSIGIKIEYLLKEKNVIQLGFEPVRIDLLMSIDGVSFEEAYQKRVQNSFGNQIANFLSLDCLIKNKISTGRKKDLADIENLTKK